MDKIFLKVGTYPQSLMPRGDGWLVKMGVNIQSNYVKGFKTWNENFASIITPTLKPVSFFYLRLHKWLTGYAAFLVCIFTFKTANGYRIVCEERLRT